MNIHANDVFKQLINSLVSNNKISLDAKNVLDNYLLNIVNNSINSVVNVSADDQLSVLLKKYILIQTLDVTVHDVVLVNQMVKYGFSVENIFVLLLINNLI